MAVFQIGQQAIKPTALGEIASGLQAFRAGQQGLQDRKMQQQLNQLKLQQLRAQIEQIGQQKPLTPGQGISQLQLDFLKRLPPDKLKEVLQQMITKPASQTNIALDLAGTKASAEQQAKNLVAMSAEAAKLNASGKFPNATVVVGTDAKGNSVLKFEQKAAPAAAERTKIAEAKASIDALNNLKTLFDDLETQTGPIIGRATPPLGLIGKTTQKQENLLAATFAFKNRIIKEITGAQMSEQEATRIMKQVPDITDPAKRWQAKWDQTVKNLKFIQARRQEVLRSAGLRPTGVGDIKQFKEQPGAFTIGEIRKNSVGKEYRYIGKGKWQAVK